MTSLGLAAAAAVMLAGSGAADVSTAPATGHGLDLGDAKVIEARVGYFRRDLGNDPAYGNYQHFDRHQGDPYKRKRGFRSYTPPTYNGAGVIFFYDGGHSYSVNPGSRGPRQHQNIK